MCVPLYTLARQCHASAGSRSQPYGSYPAAAAAAGASSGGAAGLASSAVFRNAFVFVVGPTVFILNLVPTALGSYVRTKVIALDGTKVARNGNIEGGPLEGGEFAGEEIAERGEVPDVETGVVEEFGRDRTAGPVGFLA